MLEERLVRQLLGEEPMSEEAARWSVWAWARALGHSAAPGTPAAKPPARGRADLVWTAGLAVIALLGLVGFLLAPRMIRARGQAMLGTDDRRAVVWFSRALRLSPKDRAARLGRATGYLGLRDPRAAEDDLNEVLRVDSRSAKAYFLRGQARAAHFSASRCVSSHSPPWCPPAPFLTLGGAFW